MIYDFVSLTLSISISKERVEGEEREGQSCGVGACLAVIGGIHCLCHLFRYAIYDSVLTGKALVFALC